MDYLPTHTCAFHMQLRKHLSEHINGRYVCARQPLASSSQPDLLRAQIVLTAMLKC
jgi:hypothetical protein